MTDLRFDGRVAIITGAGGGLGRCHALEQCSVNGHVYSVAGGRIARIFVAETRGVVFTENTPEAIQSNLSLIDELGIGGFDQPSSLEDEITIVAKALAQAY